jgi:murein DD-endopeptidase MepM/ murein hydrolase activator NlpD
MRAGARRCAAFLVAPMAGLILGGTGVSLAAAGSRPVVDTATPAKRDSVVITVQLIRTLAEDRTQEELTRPAPMPVLLLAPAGGSRSAATLALQAMSQRAVPSPTALPRAPGQFVRPASGKITGPFGERRGSHRHPGVDFDGETGGPVRAAGAGVVVVAGWAPNGYRGYGRMVVIDHGGNIRTVYAHLSAARVAPGQQVTTGQLIGAIGTTGSVTGSHLHFEVRRAGVPTNPMPWLTGRATPPPTRRARAQRN